MLKGDSTFTMLIVALILALGVGYYVPRAFVARPAETLKSEAPRVRMQGAVPRATLVGRKRGRNAADAPSPP
jgi:hypothetical protein